MYSKTYFSVLILRSDRTHSDLDLVVAGLRERGIKTDVFNLNAVLKGDRSFDEFIDGFNWSEIGAIDLRYCRGIPRNWQKGYRQLFKKLQDFLELQKNAGNFIAVNPSFETLDWVIDKAAYFEEIQRMGIPTIPTVILHPSSKGSQFDLVDYFNRNEIDRIVLKPAIGSGADGLEFVSKINEKKARYEVKIYSRDEGDRGIEKNVTLGSDRELQNYLPNYRQRYNSPIILQNFEEITGEISAVFIDGEPHFVERSLGKNSLIAHEKFGGENVFILNPPPEWKIFAQRIYRELPRAAKNTISLRIDMFERPDGELILSEIEGASQRLFLPETLKHYKEEIAGEKLEISKQELSKISRSKKYVETLCKMITVNC